MAMPFMYQLMSWCYIIVNIMSPRLPIRDTVYRPTLLALQADLWMLPCDGGKIGLWEELTAELPIRTLLSILEPRLFVRRYLRFSKLL